MSIGDKPFIEDAERFGIEEPDESEEEEEFYSECERYRHDERY